MKCREPLCRARPEYNGVCNWHNIVWIERLTYGLEQAVQIAVERTGIDVDWVGHEQGIPIPSPSLVVIVNQVFSDRTRDWLKLYEESLVKYNLAEEEAETQQYITETQGALKMTSDDWPSARPANQEMKKPELQDFGITEKDYALFDPTRGPSGKVWLFTGVFLYLVVLSFTGDVVGSLLGFLATPFVVYFVDDWVIVRYKRYRLGKPKRLVIKQFQEVLGAYYDGQQEAERSRREAEKALWEAEEAAERQRRAIKRQRREAKRQQWRIREQYWESMDGIGFERELGGLFQAMDYGVEMTPTSGDQGVDLVLRKNGVTTVVQCKAQKARASSPIARELLGSMVAFGAQKAILACTGGFTRGVREFVEGKPISLLDSSDIARMAEGVGGVVDKLPKAARKGRADQEREPSCPKCRRRMVLREGSRGEFWGCPAYPQCNGTRDVRSYYFRG